MQPMPQMQTFLLVVRKVSSSHCPERGDYCLGPTLLRSAKQLTTSTSFTCFCINRQQPLHTSGGHLALAASLPYPTMAGFLKSLPSTPSDSALRPMEMAGVARYDDGGHFHQDHNCMWLLIPLGQCLLNLKCLLQCASTCGHIVDLRNRLHSRSSSRKPGNVLTHTSRHFVDSLEKSNFNVHLSRLDVLHLGARLSQNISYSFCAPTSTTP